jgi:hypothetical protein
MTLGTLADFPTSGNTLNDQGRAASNGEDISLSSVLASALESKFVA